MIRNLKCEKVIDLENHTYYTDIRARLPSAIYANPGWRSPYRFVLFGIRSVPDTNKVRRPNCAASRRYPDGYYIPAPYMYTQ